MESGFNSIFSERWKHDEKLWHRPASGTHISEIEDEILLRGPFFKVHKSDKISKKYALVTKRHLFYTNSPTSTRVQGKVVLPYIFAKFRTVSKDSEKMGGFLYRLLIFKETKFSELLFKEKDLFEKLEEHLRPICYLSSFKKDYEMIKHIASGKISDVTTKLKNRFLK